jgi:hypothetical protein
MSPDISVESLRQELDNQGTGFQLPEQATDFSVLHNLQTPTGAHEASYLTATKSISAG